MKSIKKVCSFIYNAIKFQIETTLAVIGGYILVFLLVLPFVLIDFIITWAQS